MECIKLLLNLSDKSDLIISVH